MERLTQWLRLAAALYFYDQAMRSHILKRMEVAYPDAWENELFERVVGEPGVLA